MTDPFSLILMPTLKCNADCAYCFEDKTEDTLGLDQFSTIVSKTLDYMDDRGFDTLLIHWQGGEVMTLPPSWFERAYEIVQRLADSRKMSIRSYIQSNMIGYSKDWNRILSEMFDNSIGTSMDFPNLYRTAQGGCVKKYNEIWLRNIDKAREAGISVGVIAVPNDKTLALGAERFYSHFVDELGIVDFQINTPFPGGQFKNSKTIFPLRDDRLTRFLVDLSNIWMERGYEQGVMIGPFDSLMDYFAHGGKSLPCIWRDNCANEFICIDPRGNVAQCDCWAATYPEFHFGNILGDADLAELLTSSEARDRLLDRSSQIIQREDCLDCEYLALCHGGCPIRSYTVWGDLTTKDPYCETYKALFRRLENITPTLVCSDPFSRASR